MSFVRSIARVFASGRLAAVFLYCVCLSARGASLVPLDDPETTNPMLPVEVSRVAPEFFGDYAHVWALPDGCEVVQYYGDLAVHLGDRRLSAREAVTWMQQCRWQGQAYYHFEVFLSQQARVQDAGGTVTTGPVLFVTFNTKDPPVLQADVTTRESSAETPLYAEAVKIRQVVLARTGPTTQPGGVEIVDLEQPELKPRPEARPLVHYHGNQTSIDEGRGTVTAIGKVYVSQGLVDSGDFLEIRADAAVIFLSRRPKEASSASSVSPSAETQAFPPERAEGESRETDAGVAGVGSLGASVGEGVSGVYLQGDVVLTRGERMIRASELYYDFENDRALILDVVMRALAPGGELPIYVRAQQVRQLSTTEYLAHKAIVTTSEFHTPHVHIGAEQVRLIDATPRDESGQVAGLQAGRYQVRDATLNVEGVPLAYWPYVTGDLKEGESSIRSVRTGYSEKYGVTLESKWYLFNLLGLEKPKGVDGTLRLDYFSEHGPGVGTDVDYETENSFGVFRGYYIHDTGRDSLGSFRDNDPDTENRGRLTWRHREILGQGWELTLEGSYLSDPTFMEQYFEGEYDEGKEQETLAYLKKQKDNWAVTGLVQARVLDFLTQTEHFPELAYYLAGEPLAEIASFYSESHLGMARYRPDSRRLWDRKWVVDNTGASDMTFQSETRNEFDVPIKLGSANIVPFATGRAGYWDGSAAGGSRDRLFGMAGVRTGTEVWRLFDTMNSELLDVHGVRHVIRPEATAWMSTTNTNSLELHPFSPGVEDIDDFYGASLAVRQRWQTKRGLPGGWRVVDWILFDVELNLFGDHPEQELPIGRYDNARPENSVARNHVRSDFQYRISDTTSVLSDANWDLSDGSLDLFNLSYAVERSPRLSYFVGYRRIEPTDSNLIGGGANYELNAKHRLALRAFYDIERGKLDQLEVTVVRKFPRWYAALTFAVDEQADDLSLGLSVWPEGAPQAAIGNRRYTKLGASTGIKPEN